MTALVAALGVVGVAASTAGSAAGAAPERSAAVAAAVPTKWVSVSAAGDVTCAIDTAQHLWCWGANYYGQVGDGTTEVRPLPVQIGTARWRSVRTAADTTCGIKTDGTGWCWGSNGMGQVGNGEATEPVLVPTRVAGAIRWSRMTSGQVNTCGVSTAGALYCWGSDEYGSVGDGTNDASSPQVIPLPTKISNATDWTGLTVGAFSSCAVKSTGKAFCWGNGGNGQTGVGTFEDQYSPVPITGTWRTLNTTAYTVCGVTTGNVSQCWGYNTYGQGGSASVGVGALTSPTRLSEQSTDFSRVVAGYNASCAVRTVDARIRCFGNNAYGQFGDGTTDGNGPTPVPAAGNKAGWTQLSMGDYHVCGLRDGGKLFCWGANRYGQVGVGTTGFAYTSPVRVGSTPPPGQVLKKAPPKRPALPLKH